ncbi:gamma-aminobutyric acid type B receptor subunit 2-like isoform X2 [Montipora capricornis]|uniref:gamma-aminobutyric acid type B receptor subunit 2-like isoform X2 n=1 Tax=Montipora capricornis TaxID=246305 RepID=UPI0035F16B2F
MKFHTPTFFLFLWATKISSAKTPIYIGGFFPLSPNKASVPGRALLAAAEMALDHVNKSAILRDYELRMIVKDSKCDLAYSANMFMDLLSEKPNCLMTFGAACSDVTEILAEMSAYRELVQISYASRSLALSNREKFPTLFRALPSESARNLARIAWIEHFGWKHVATMYEKTSMDLASQSNTQVIEQLQATNRTVLLSEEITKQHVDLKLKTLARNDARIIVGTFYEALARHIFCQAYKSDLFGARYVWILIGTYTQQWWSVPDPSLECTKEEMQKAVAYTFIFNNQIFVSEENGEKQNQTLSGLTNNQFYEEYRGRLQKLKLSAAPNITAYTYDALWTIAACLNKSIPALERMGLQLQDFSQNKKEMTELFVQTIQDIHVLGVTGEVAFFSDGDRYDGMVEILQQHPDGHAVAVGYYDARVGRLRLVKQGNVWPGGKIPGDKIITVNEFVQIPLWLIVSACTLSFLGIALALFLLWFNLRYRAKRYIKLSSPNLNNVILLGGIIMYSTVVMYGWDGRLSPINYTRVCRVRFCLLSLGFTVGFGAMFSKTWRVFQIFTNITKVRKVVLDSDLFRMLGALLVVDVSLLVTWMTLHPPSRRVVVQNEGSHKVLEDRDYKTVLYREECVGPHFTIWSIVLCTFHSLLLIFGLFLAFETRNVSIPALNDSRFIGISVYNVVVLSAIGVPMSFFTNNHATVSFSLICAVILFCTTLTIGILFVPKVIKIYKNPDENPMRASRPGNGLLTGRPLAQSGAEESHRVVEEENLNQAMVKASSSHQDK